MVTVIRSELRRVGKAGLFERLSEWPHAECMGSHWKVISSVWQYPFGFCVENGLLGAGGNEGDGEEAAAVTSVP